MAGRWWLCLFFVLSVPVAVSASAVKTCRVDATVREVLKDGPRPKLRIFARKAVFKAGHSMGEDCKGLVGSEHIVKLPAAFPTQFAAEIVLYYTEVFSETQAGKLQRHTSWSARP